MQPVLEPEGITVRRALLLLPLACLGSICACAITSAKSRVLVKTPVTIDRLVLVLLDTPFSEGSAASSVGNANRRDLFRDLPERLAAVFASNGVPVRTNAISPASADAGIANEKILSVSATHSTYDSTSSIAVLWVQAELREAPQGAPLWRAEVRIQSRLRFGADAAESVSREILQRLRADDISFTRSAGLPS